MESQDQAPEEETINPKQFQFGHNLEAQEEQENQNDRANTQEAGYTSGETEFADGKDTRLDQGIEELEIDQETDDFDDSQTASESDGEDADFENPEEDPA